MPTDEITDIASAIEAAAKVAEANLSDEVGTEIATAIRLLKDRVASPSDGAMEDEAARKLVDALIAKTWRWGHGCAVDDIHDMPTIGDSYNEGGREESTKLGNSLVSIFSEMSASHKAMRTSRDRTRAALEKMRASDPAAEVTAEQLWNEAARGRTFSITQTCYQTAIAAIEAALALRPQPDLRAMLEKIRRSMALLQQNSEGCALNHYGGDGEQFGMPGWLVDTKADLESLTDIVFDRALSDGAEG